MGEARRGRQGALIQGGGEAEQPQVVDTLGGRMHVRWDSGAAATRCACFWYGSFRDGVGPCAEVHRSTAHGG